MAVFGQRSATARGAFHPPQALMTLTTMTVEGGTFIKRKDTMNSRVTEDLLPQKTVLLLIDVQKGFDDPVWGERNNPQAEENIARLLARWRMTRRPVYHVQHLSRLPLSPLNPAHPGHELKEVARPAEGEPLFQKHVNSAFIGTNLEEKLREVGCEALVITGLTTPHCVSTTARMAGNLGFRTLVVSDATAAFALTGHDGRRYSAEEIHAVSLATLHEEFATIVDTETLLGRVR